MAFIQKPLAFLKKDFYIQTSYKLFFILNIIEIFAFSLTFFFISKLFGKNLSPYLKNYGLEYFPFVLIGIAFSKYLSISLNAFSINLRSEQMLGTLEAMLSTPTKISTILISMSLWRFLFASFNILVYILMGVLLFGVDFSRANWLIAAPIILLTIIAFSCIGIISASFIMLFKEGDPVNWLITTLSGLLGGVYYPVEVLPKFLQYLAKFLPITYSLRSLRLTILKGYSFPEILPDLVILFIFCLILFPVSILLFKLSLKRAKILGTLVYH